jgi:hypothetical protein
MKNKMFSIFTIFLWSKQLFACEYSAPLPDFTRQLAVAVAAANKKEISCLIGKEIDSDEWLYLQDESKISKKFRTPQQIANSKNLQIFFLGDSTTATPVEVSIFFISHPVKIDRRSFALLYDMVWRKDYVGTVVFWDGKRWRGKYSLFYALTDDHI